VGAFTDPWIPLRVGADDPFAAFQIFDVTAVVAELEDAGQARYPGAFQSRVIVIVSAEGPPYRSLPGSRRDAGLEAPAAAKARSSGSLIFRICSASAARTALK
jgi:hypothetical protein